MKVLLEKKPCFYARTHMVVPHSRDVMYAAEDTTGMGLRPDRPALPTDAGAPLPSMTTPGSPSLGAQMVDTAVVIYDGLVDTAQDVGEAIVEGAQAVHEYLKKEREERERRQREGNG